MHAAVIFSRVGASERAAVAAAAAANRDSGVSVRGCPSRGAPVDRLLRPPQYAARREPVCRSFFSNDKRHRARESPGTARAFDFFIPRPRDAVPSRVEPEPASSGIGADRCVRCDRLDTGSATRGHVVTARTVIRACARARAHVHTRRREAGRREERKLIWRAFPRRLATWRWRNFRAPFPSRVDPLAWHAHACVRACVSSFPRPGNSRKSLGAWNSKVRGKSLLCGLRYAMKYIFFYLCLFFFFFM